MAQAAGVAWRPLVSRGTAVAGATVLAVAYFQRRGEDDRSDYLATWSQGLLTRCYRSFVKPLIVYTDPEFAHQATIAAGRAFQAARLLGEPAWTGSTPLDWLVRPPALLAMDTKPSLRQELFEGRLCFDTPLGIAAGFDKNANLVPLYRVGAIPGLGFSEVGSISALPSSGNSRPRCFRLVEDEAVINRMGLNNDGAEAVATRLQRFACLGSASSGKPPVGVNIAKTHSPEIMGQMAVEDFLSSYRTLEAHADFIVLNVSCPNTAEGKTFEDPATLKTLLEAVQRERSTSSASSSPPVLVKLSPPPMAEASELRLRELVQIAEQVGVVDGYVVSNTVGDRDVPLTAEGKTAAEAIGKGGLSGKPIRERSTAAVRIVYEATKGSKPIIGCGGIDSVESAYAKIRAGASLIEIYTGLIYSGPGLLTDLNNGLRRLLHRDGFSSIKEAVGADVRAAS